jgi:hypothetical protein
MRFISVALVALAVVVSSPRGLLAQAVQSPPRLISVSGVFQPADGKAPASVEEVTISIYADESGGTALYQETQSIEVDSSGRYALLMGATEARGVPLDLFASGEARWFGMTWGRPGETEGPRTRLATVPYALSASNAETLGGKPASAYVLAPTAVGDGTVRMGTTSASAPETTVINPGTTNFIAKYVTAADLGNSALYESGGRLGVNTTTPLDMVHSRFTNTGGGLTGYAVQNLGTTATSYSGMLFFDQTGALGQFQGFNNVTHEYRINNIARTSGTLDGSINFMIGSASKFIVKTDGKVGIGTTDPAFKLMVVDSSNAGLRVDTQVEGGTVASFGGSGQFDIDAPGIVGGRFVVKENGRIGIGMPLFADAFGLPAFKVQVIDPSNTGLRVQTETPGGTVASFGGRGDFLIDAEGVIAGRFIVKESGFTGIGTADPGSRLDVNGIIRVRTLGAGGSTALCLNGSNEISNCSSSLRYKMNVAPFHPGLDLLERLRPVTFDWKTNGEADLGLAAEEVARVEPLLVIHNDRGEVEGVKYDRINMVLINAIKEQQAQITRQQAQIDELRRQQADLEALEKLICADHPAAAACKSY